MAKINWNNILSRVINLAKSLAEQNFRIDVGHNLYTRFRDALSRRNDLNLGVITSYWAKHVLDHYLLNNFIIDANEVFIEEHYYSYINLLEMSENNVKGNTTTFIVDFITDTTDLKTGEDLEQWLSSNDVFEDNMKAIWMNKVLAYWIQEGKLVTRKSKTINIEHYWKNEDYIYTIRVWDSDFNIMVVFLLGTYDNYVSNTPNIPGRYQQPQPPQPPQSIQGQGRI